MTTDKINEKLKVLARKELEQVAEDFVDLLKNKYPEMMRRFKEVKIPANYFYVTQKNNQGEVLNIGVHSIAFKTGKNESDFKYLLEFLLVGIYGEALHQKKVNELVSKLEIFE